MKRPSKYGAIAAYRCADCGADIGAPAKCFACGGGKSIRFASKAEARRYDTLRFMLKHGQIADLREQVAYDIIVNEKTIGLYRADFVYTDCETGERIVEDVKGVETPAFKLKRKAIEAQYGFKIRIVR